MTVYFWHKGQVKKADVVEDFYSCPCIDTDHNDPKYRYGNWPTESSKWTPIPLVQFPKEFRLALLLLGVS